MNLWRSIAERSRRVRCVAGRRVAHDELGSNSLLAVGGVEQFSQFGLQ